MKSSDFVKLMKGFAGICICMMLGFGIPCNTIGQEKIELRKAKELSATVEDGQSIREAKGDVEFLQGNVRVFCNSARQFITSNRVELTGNVRIYQDTLTLQTNKAVYFGDTRMAVCEGAVTLKDQNATLRSDKGVYTFNDAKAVFNGDVIIINPDYRITSEELTYFRNTEESYAKGDVIVVTDSNIIKAEQIDFFRREGRTFARGGVVIEGDSTVIRADTATNYGNDRRSSASGNVSVYSPGNKTRLFGDRLDNFERDKLSVLYSNAAMFQTDNEQDTLIIYSDTMKAYRASPEMYEASGNVEIIRNDFFARCGLASYFREIETVSLTQMPVVWQDDLQLTGDSIIAELPGEKLRRILAESSSGSGSFAVSTNKEPVFSDRYDQLNGSSIEISFSEEKITTISVNKNAKSIYYVYEEGNANGMNRIEGEDLFIYFDDKEEISRIKVSGDPIGEYVPENLLGGTERLLPGFGLKTGKPVRRDDGRF